MISCKTWQSLCEEFERPELLLFEERCFFLHAAVCVSTSFWATALHNHSNVVYFIFSMKKVNDGLYHVIPSSVLTIAPDEAF